MFTNLFTQVITILGVLPVPLLYVIVAIWIGLDSAGIPLPMEPLLLFMGSFAALGHASHVLVIFSAVIGALAFASLAYALGRRYGAAAVGEVTKLGHIKPERAQHVELWLQHHGAPAVIVASMVPILRTFSAYVMGVANISRATFTICILTGGLLYSSLWILLGSALGSNYRAPLHFLDTVGLVGFLIVAVVLVATATIHHFWGRLTLNRIELHYHRHSGELATGTPVMAMSGAGSVAALGASGTAGQRYVSTTTTGSTNMADTPSNAQTGGHRGLQLSRAGVGQGAGQSQTHLHTLNAQMQAAAATSWSDGAISVVIGLWLAGFITLAVIAVSAHQYAEFPYDASITAWVKHLVGTPLTRPIEAAADAQWFLPTGIALVLIFGTLLFLRLYSAVVCLAIASFGTDLVNVIINTLVSRPRPNGVHITTLVSNFGQSSFPSGHVAHTVGLYGFVFYLCLLGARARPDWRPALIVVQVICGYFIVFVGLGRVMEGAHWPSDVEAGYLVGALVLTVAITIYHVHAERTVQRLATEKTEHEVQVAAG